ncbi:MAG: hypothetical protein QOH49_86 [Acidobacteriota bacterium]|jgi:hypothetical protein|nr:hypothetical protein [Acidobacteriota bacterium]
MKAKQLTETITEDGLPWVNFFNGRLLSGEDLSSDQNSYRRGHRRLGQATGEGVAFGLEVTVPKGVDTRAAPSVEVGAGLAVNRQGQTLALAQPAAVALTRPSNVAADARAGGGFDDCLPLQAGNYVADAGVYLLTIAPARAGQGRAPVSGLDNLTARCNTRYNVEGVQFRLLQLDLGTGALSDANHLRNLAAYRCFGIDSLTRPSFHSRLPEVPPEGARLLDALRPHLLTDCDVPLALLSWTTTGGINYVDMWAVRRRVCGPSAGAPWDSLIGDVRRAEAEAMFLQFQEHAEWLRTTEGSPRTLAATERFFYLPPAGVVPLASDNSPKGFDRERFFRGLTVRAPAFIEGARVEQVLRHSLSYSPLNLGSGELLWLYEVRENAQDIDDRVAPAPQPYLLFTSGHMPFYGEAWFDVSRWDYSNYSSALD